MGILRYGLDNVPLGIDAAGTIRRTGSNVDNVAIGDRIFALAPYGCITDRLVLPMQLAVKIPDDLSFGDAATMPCCFATAIYSLLDVGRLKKGQVSDTSPQQRKHRFRDAIASSTFTDVLVFRTNGFTQTALIHSASGGVGYACLQVCAMTGIEARFSPRNGIVPF